MIVTVARTFGSRALKTVPAGAGRNHGQADSEYRHPDLVLTLGDREQVELRRLPQRWQPEISRQILPRHPLGREALLEPLADRLPLQRAERTRRRDGLLHGVHHEPLTPWPITSGTEPWARAITGVPQAMASRCHVLDGGIKAQGHLRAWRKLG